MNDRNRAAGLGPPGLTNPTRFIGNPNRNRETAGFRPRLSLGIPATGGKPYVALTVLAVGLLPTLGCRGHATIYQIPVGVKRISTTTPLVQRITPNECYYWIDDSGDLGIAMREVKRSILGDRFSGEFILSLRLDGLPADTARNYRVNRRTLRARRRAGYSHTRTASLAGIATVWDYGKRKLRGRFRLSAKRQSYSVLTGWGANAGVLIVGEFKAVPNRKAGEKILAQTEERGLQRPPPRPRPKRVIGPPRPGQPVND